MKVTFLLITVIAYICLVSCAAEKSNPLEGTWELISAKEITSDSTTDNTPGEFERSLKIINKTHFATVTQDTSEQSNSFNAGTYRFSENIYTENIEFFPSFPDFIGESFSFKIEMVGNQFTMTGPLKKEGESEPEWQLEEVWKKVN